MSNPTFVNSTLKVVASEELDVSKDLEQTAPNKSIAELLNDSTKESDEPKEEENNI